MNDFVDKLATAISAPKLWLKNRIIPSSMYSKDFTEGWMLNTEFGIPFCYIPSVTNDNYEFVEQNIYGILNGKNDINLAILLTENNSFNVYKWNYLKNNVQKHTGKFDVFKSFDKKYWYKKSLNKSDSKNELELITSKIENKIFQIHSFIRDIDALHPDAALDEICKLLYVKIYDEEITKKGDYYKFQRNRYITTEECASVIRNLYKEANEHDYRVFSLRIPGYKRSRGVFDTPIMLSSEAIVKVVEHIQALSFSNSEIDLKGRIFQNLISPVLRGGFGQYFTPFEVVEFIVNLIKPTLNDLIIDPFAGSGHFLTSSIRYVKKNNQDVTHKKIDDFLFTHLHGMEISERMVRISMTDMRLHGDGHSNIRCVDALLDFSNYQDLHKDSFDVVMTNPPFGSLLNTDGLTKIGDFSLAKPKKNTPLEVLGLERSTELLREGGKIAIVLPESVFVNSNLKYVRDWIVSNIHVLALISLPIETFSPYGANIKTSILIGKKTLSEVARPDSKSKVFIAEVKNIGYDSSGRKVEKSDLDSIMKEFNQFIKKSKIKW
ncbi:MAG: N-6 DNA methylase [Chitinophagaceae bacterium]|nr:N-6 DNA methylase [Chitinophagaceae bacterium]